MSLRRSTFTSPKIDRAWQPERRRTHARLESSEQQFSGRRSLRPLFCHSLILLHCDIYHIVVVSNPARQTCARARQFLRNEATNHFVFNRFGCFARTFTEPGARFAFDLPEAIDSAETGVGLRMLGYYERSSPPL